MRFKDSQCYSWMTWLHLASLAMELRLNAGALSSHPTPLTVIAVTATPNVSAFDRILNGNPNAWKVPGTTRFPSRYSYHKSAQAFGSRNEEILHRLDEIVAGKYPEPDGRTIHLGVEIFVAGKDEGKLCSGPPEIPKVHLFAVQRDVFG